ncbi:MAG: hypothetical protein LAN63_12555 [Acidobacteriia bacterium]|nr:hypothetical protein [Terriglobia bacterium]
MKRRIFEEVGELLSSGIRGCPPSHTPVASLTITLVGMRRAEKPLREPAAIDKTIAIVVCTVIVLVALAASCGVVLAQDYLGNHFSQTMQELHQYSCRDVPCSEVAQGPGNW